MKKLLLGLVLLSAISYPINIQAQTKDILRANLKTVLAQQKSELQVLKNSLSVQLSSVKQSNKAELDRLKSQQKNEIDNLKSNIKDQIISLKANQKITADNLRNQITIAPSK